MTLPPPTKDSSLSGPVLILQPHQRFRCKSTIGIGTFGAVFLAVDLSTSRDVAIKKVFLDPRFKSRELEILQHLNHPNCLHLIHSYTTTESKPPLVFLHLVTDYFPGSLSTFRGNPVPYLKIFGYQLFAGLCYLHNHEICHRDIKPSNILVNPQFGFLQLCDFGSAKVLKRTEVSVSYIATRSYRAPELLLDCPFYTTKIDIWAAGCVLAEFANGGRLLFPGFNNSEVMESIGKTIGVPESGDFDGFAHKKQFNVGDGKVRTVAEFLGKGAAREFIELLNRIFVYAPENRPTAEECMEHPFFAEVRAGRLKLPNGGPLPAYLGKMRSAKEMLGNFPRGP
jgi:glycogen synthase kinase 3 beta